jgi:hypothetical protein
MTVKNLKTIGPHGPRVWMWKEKGEKVEKGKKDKRKKKKEKRKKKKEKRKKKKGHQNLKI